MKRICVAIGILCATVTARAQLFLAEGNQDNTNVTLTTTNTVAMTQILPAAGNAISVSAIYVSSATNSSTVAMIVYGTNTVSGGGRLLLPGTTVSFIAPPHPQGALYGYLTTSGTVTLSITRAPTSNFP